MKIHKRLTYTIYLTLFMVIQFNNPISARIIYNHNYDDTSLVRMDSKWAGRFYEVFKIIDHVLTKHDIPYTLSGGSLLGAVRHKGLIPWDSDGDIDIRDEDYEKLLSLRDEFDKFDLRLEVVQGGHIVIKGNLLHINRNVSIDVFQFKYIKDKERFHLVNHFSKNIVYPKWNYIPEEYEEFTKADFGPIKMSVPKKPLGILCRYYGEDVFDIVCHYNNNDLLKKFYGITNPSHPLGNNIYNKVKLVTRHSVDYESVDPRVSLDDLPIDESLFDKSNSPFRK